MWHRVGRWGPWILSITGLGIGIGLGVRALSISGKELDAWLPTIAHGKPILWGDPAWYAGLLILNVLILTLHILQLNRN